MTAPAWLLSAPWLPVDAELLFVTLLQQRLADTGVTVQAAPDADVSDFVPVVILSVYGGHRVANGAPELGQAWTLGVTLLAEGKELAADLNRRLYYEIHNLQDTPSGVAGVGFVSTVDDNEIPVRVATVILANSLTQYTGSFAVAVQPLQ